MSDLIFLDTETTGLEPEKHKVWEIAWAINDGPIEARFLPHSLRSADPKALELNGYFGRMPTHSTIWDRDHVDLMLREMLKGHTLVCSNPTFDRMMLRARWGEEPWHHRSIDISSYAMILLKHERPSGLARVAEDLRGLGFDIPAPDHTAAGDVRVLRDCFYALQSYSN